MGRGGCGWLLLLLLLVALPHVECKSLKIRMNEADCSSFLNCTSCTNDPACGWCDSDPPVCVPGDINSPTDPSVCINALWKYADCQEDDLCSLQSDCASCTHHGGCGWCDTRCVTGNSSMPTNQEVPCDFYIYHQRSCSSPSCSAFSTCDVCNQQTDCAWCQETVFGVPTCLLGNATNPNEACYPHNWKPQVDQCTAPPCAIYQNCSTCLADPNQQCGWCDSTSQCVPRDQPGTCTDFQENSCNDDCTNFRDCDSCTSYDHCGWCNSRLKGSFCTYGNQTGPSYVGHCEWHYDICSPVSECHYNDCTACEQDNECSWCFVPRDGTYVGECFPYLEEPNNATCIGCLQNRTHSATISNTPSPSNSLARSNFPSRSSSPSVSLSPSSSASASASNSVAPSASFTPSSSIVSRSSSPSPSTSVSPSFSSSRSFSRTPSSSVSPSPSLSASVSRSGTPSPSPSQSPSLSISRSGSVTFLPPILQSRSVAKTTRVSQTGTRSPSASNPTHSVPCSCTVTASPSQSLSSSTVGETHTPDIPWGGIGILLFVICLGILLTGVVGFFIFYRFYWLKRWYFVRLE